MIDSTQLRTELEIRDLLHCKIQGRYPQLYIILLQTSKQISDSSLKSYTKSLEKKKPRPSSKFFESSLIFKKSPILKTLKIF